MSKRAPLFALLLAAVGALVAWWLLASPRGNRGAGSAANVATPGSSRDLPATPGATTGGAGGILNLSKSGASALILNNPSPTYGATATINAGTLQLGDGVVALTTLPANPIVCR